jgi:RNA polymerase sigma factor (TIGR02999 family)
VYGDARLHANRATHIPLVRPRCPNIIAGMGEITLLLSRMGAGEEAAANELMRIVYSELHAVASAKMSHEHAAMTLQPTALVHEAWLRLGGDDQPNWQNRRHFFYAAAEAMRRILIERARRRAAVRHGGGQIRVDEQHLDSKEIAPDDDRVVMVSDALDRLALVDPRKAELVKLRYFAGMTLEEVSAAMDISVPTAKRWWVFAKAWLYREVKN